LVAQPSLGARICRHKQLKAQLKHKPMPLPVLAINKPLP
jgi:hypothetical protein